MIVQHLELSYLLEVTKVQAVISSPERELWNRLQPSSSDMRGPERQPLVKFAGSVPRRMERNCRSATTDLCPDRREYHRNCDFSVITDESAAIGLPDNRMNESVIQYVPCCLI
eukprot:scpid105850/ scgid16937/ 